MSKSLFHINSEHLAIMEQIMEADGELTPEMEQALQINEAELSVKATSYVNFMAMLKGQNDSIKAEIDRLTKLKKSRENLHKRLSEVLVQAVNLHGEIQTDLHKIGTRKSTVVEVEDVAKLPDSYLTKKLSITPDKTAIKEALKAGKKVKGASLVEKQNLSVK